MGGPTHNCLVAPCPQPEDNWQPEPKQPWEMSVDPKQNCQTVAAVMDGSGYGPGGSQTGFFVDSESNAVPMPEVGDPNWGAKNDPGFEVAGESWRTPYIREWQRHWNKNDPYKVTDPERLKNLQDIVIFHRPV